MIEIYEGLIFSQKTFIVALEKKYCELNTSIYEDWFRTIEVADLRSEQRWDEIEKDMNCFITKLNVIKDSFFSKSGEQSLSGLDPYAEIFALNLFSTSSNELNTFSKEYLKPDDCISIGFSII